VPITNHIYLPPPVHDWPYGNWDDDCPPPDHGRWPSVSAPPHSRVVVPDPPSCTSHFGVNTDWRDNECGNLHESAAQAGPAEPTIPPVSARPCVLNLGIDRNWLDNKCAKLDESAAQASVVQPADGQAYRSIFANLGFGIALAVVAVAIALVCARLAAWTFNEWSSRTKRQESNHLSPLTPEHLAEDVYQRHEPFDRRAQQAQQLADRIKEVQTSLFGRP
jgi:hypothetical protein